MWQAIIAIVPGWPVVLFLLVSTACYYARAHWQQTLTSSSQRLKLSTTTSSTPSIQPEDPRTNRSRSSSRGDICIQQGVSELAVEPKRRYSHGGVVSTNRTTPVGSSLSLASSYSGLSSNSGREKSPILVYSSNDYASAQSSSQYHEGCIKMQIKMFHEGIVLHEFTFGYFR